MLSNTSLKICGSNRPQSFSASRVKELSGGSHVRGLARARRPKHPLRPQMPPRQKLRVRHAELFSSSALESLAPWKSDYDTGAPVGDSPESESDNQCETTIESIKKCPRDWPSSSKRSKMELNFRQRRFSFPSKSKNKRANKAQEMPAPPATR
jgi:hypothetical protein